MAKIWIAAVIGVLAVVDDVTRRRISNWICVAVFLAGIALQTFEGGWRGGVASMLGSLTGGAVFLVFYILGGMGGGDIKLMAGFGALLGTRGILEATLWTAGCGGLLALGVILMESLRGLMSKRERRKDQRAESIPYAPAIAAGVWLSLIPKG